jgi:predicted enzyme related to lactoylglutathione lyase
MATQQLNAKLVICSVPTKNSAASQKFYNALFGGDDFARSLNDKIESYFRPISQDGVNLTVTARQNDREPITVYFAVDNLDQTVKALEAAGGKLVVNSTPMPLSGKPEAVKAFSAAHGAQATSSGAGHFATMQDPDGNYLGLMQLEDAVSTLLHAKPEHRQLSPTQVSSLEGWKKVS